MSDSVNDDAIAAKKVSDRARTGADISREIENEFIELMTNPPGVVGSKEEFLGECVGKEFEDSKAHERSYEEQMRLEMMKSAGGD